jgi:23S rRNA (adenine2030-N6)-methyltransferase
LVSKLTDQSRLNGSGLILVNPPWTLESDLQTLLPVLARLLEREPGGGSMRVDWLVGETGSPAPRKPGP